MVKPFEATPPPIASSAETTHFFRVTQALFKKKEENFG